MLQYLLHWGISAVPIEFKIKRIMRGIISLLYFYVDTLPSSQKFVVTRNFFLLHFIPHFLILNKNVSERPSDSLSRGCLQMPPEIPESDNPEESFLCQSSSVPQLPSRHLEEQSSSSPSGGNSSEGLLRNSWAPMLSCHWLHALRSH